MSVPSRFEALTPDEREALIEAAERSEGETPAVVASALFIATLDIIRKREAEASGKAS